jgi:hypothetical protein
MPKMPEFHADAKKFPHETWLGYETAIDLVYASAGALDAANAPTDSMKKAHLLSGLKGNAARFVELIPEVRTLSYLETKQKLRSYFKRFGAPRDINLSQLQQNEDESIFEFVARLKAAVRSINPGEEFTEIGEAKKELKLAGAGQQGEDSKEVVLSTPEEITGRQKRHSEISESIALNFFLKGVRPEFKLALRVRTPKTLKEAQEIAEEQEELMVKMNDQMGSLNLTVGAPHVSRTVDVVEQSAKDLQALNNQPVPDVKNPEKKPRARSRPQQPRYRATPAERNQEDRHLLLLSITCYYCGKAGHLLRECKQKDRDLRERRRLLPARRAAPARNSEPAARRTRARRMDGSPSPAQSPVRGMHSRSTTATRGTSKPRGGQSQDTGRSSWTDNTTSEPKNGSRPTQRGGPPICALTQRDQVWRDWSPRH